VDRHGLPSGPVPIDTGTVELIIDPSDPTGVTVLVNGAESSFVDLAHPTRLEFEYMQHMAVIADHVLGPGRPVRALHLGAGACSLPRALDATRPGSRQVAVEIDAALAYLVREWFDLPRAPRLRIRVGDARQALAVTPPASQDLVVRDVFAERGVPAHLRTLEFTGQVADALRETGAYLVNCTDVPPLLDARREAATMARHFPHVAVVAEPGILKGRRYGNVVLAGTRRPLLERFVARDLLRLAMPVTLLAGQDVRRFIGAARPFLDPAA
jgi:spermidine synthase